MAEKQKQNPNLEPEEKTREFKNYYGKTGTILGIIAICCSAFRGFQSQVIWGKISRM
jgi:hypothetical protein